MPNQEDQLTGGIILYKDRNRPEIRVNLIDDTVWLSQAQMAELFEKDVRTVNDHIKSIYREAELSSNRTIRKFRIVQTEGKRRVERNVEHYNLDMIISVGYRVNSKRGTQFRIWATSKLRDLIVKGYALNEKRLKAYEGKVKELEHAKKIFQQALETRRAEGFEKDLLNIITEYLNTWTVLNEYDTGKLTTVNVTRKAAHYIDYHRAKKSVDRFRQRLVKNEQASDLFGREISGKFATVLETIKQGFHNQDLYGSLEEKAAHLFYLIIKDHPFIDGNKRIGSLMFLIFLVENRYLYNNHGERKINDAALAALALLVAESKPEQKEVMIKLVVNLINKK
jgi:prophage maintenance system killer protein